MNKSKNDSFSFMKKLNKNNFNYLHFLKPLENEINNETVYLSLDEIKKIGYNKYHTIFSDNTPYLYNSEPLHCNIYDEHKKYGESFNLKTMNGLKIMCWNVHNWVQICTNHDIHGKKRKVEEFIYFIDKYKPDIVCLQEIVPKNKESINNNLSSYSDLKKLNFKYIASLFETYGYKYNVVSNANVDATYESDDTNYYYLANGIFSKIPIQKYYIFSIPFNRNIIIIKVLYNNRVIYVVNTHLEFKRSNLKNMYSKYDYYKMLTNEESKNGFLLNMNILLALLQKIKSNNLIVCGDFNHSYAGNFKLPRLRYAIKTFIPFMKLYHDTTLYPNIFKRISNLKNKLTSDFIFLNKNSELYVEKSYILYSDLSDHYPIYTSFNWKK